MTPDEAADLAARTFAAIDGAEARMTQTRQGFAVDRERVASDLAGLRDHIDCDCDYLSRPDDACPDFDRYADGLRRTAALYGVTA